MTIDQINADIAKAADDERRLIREINALGAADANPQRDSPTAAKIRDLDKQRAAAVQRRRDLTAVRAEAQGDLAALARRRRGQGSVARAAIEEAKARLGGKASAK